MKFNDAGLNLIMSFESLRLNSYRDGGGVLTIGYGHTKNVTDGMIITVGEAVDLLKEDVEETCRLVEHALAPQIINDNRFSACCALTFNIGYGNFKESTVLHCIQKQNWDDAAAAFLLWDKVAGVHCDGLLRRRKAEQALFLSPV